MNDRSLMILSAMIGAAVGASAGAGPTVLGQRLRAVPTERPLA